MKTVIMLYMLVCIASTVSAEIYRWEDANGVNFTDEYSSVPEKYREEFIAEADAQPENSAPRDNSGLYRQNSPDVFLENKAAVRQDNLEQKKRAAEAATQKRIHTRDFQNTLQSLALYIEVLVILGLFLFVIWVVTIADIVRGEFTTPSNKIAWLLLVLLLPLVGMLSYLLLGLHHKCNSVNHKEKHRPEFAAAAPG